MVMDPVVASQREWLRELQNLIGRPILIQRHKSNVWHPWYDDIPTNPYHTRNLLPCELCLDPDITHLGPYWGLMKKGMDKIMAFLESAGVPYILAYTGGKGVHLHVFFNTQISLPDNIIKGIKIYQLDVGKVVRSFLMKWILDGAKVDNDKLLKLDQTKITWSKDSKGSMIKLFGCQYYDDKGKLIEGATKTIIEQIPEERPMPEDLQLKFPECVKLWNISYLKDDIIILLSGLIEQREQSEKEELKEALMHIVGRVFPKGRERCSGLRFAEIGVSEGIRDNVATGLICVCRGWLRMSIDKCQAFMHMWCMRCSPIFDMKAVDYKINRIYGMEQPYSPCGFFRKAGLCEECIYNEIKSTGR